MYVSNVLRGIPGREGVNTLYRVVIPLVCSFGVRLTCPLCVLYVRQRAGDFEVCHRHWTSCIAGSNVRIRIQGVVMCIYTKVHHSFGNRSMLLLGCRPMCMHVQRLEGLKVCLAVPSNPFSLRKPMDGPARKKQSHGSLASRVSPGGMVTSQQQAILSWM